jgi:tetratricopeptide (TPR) repeat protein
MSQALAALLLGTALAQAPEARHLLDALPPVARQQMELARAKEAAGELRRAEAGYSLVLTRAPGFVPAVMGLGRVRVARGDRDGAAEAYGQLPREAEAVEALARLVEEEDPARAAELYRTLLALRRGTAAPYGPLAMALARSGDLDGAQEALETWVALDSGAAAPEVFLALGIAMRDAGREDEGVVLLERALALDPDGPLAAEVRGRLDRIAVEQAARLLGLGGAEPLRADLRAELDRAGREAAAGELEAARIRLEDVVQQAPRSSEARAALGDVLLAQGEVAEAERALGWAVALEPDQSEWHARLGLLLADAYGGRRHPEAADALRRALALRPGWPALQLRLGTVLQEQGAWDEALVALRACVRLDPDGPHGDEARARIADLTREAPEPPDVAPVSGPPADVPEAALAGYRIARIYLDRGDTVRARAELLPVQKLAPDWPAVLNLEAALALREGDEAAAVAAWQRSLAQDPAQPRVKLVLGELARRDGDRGRATALLSEAAAEGAPDAHYQLAAMAFEEHRIFDARDELDAFLAASTGGLNYQPALQLQRTVGRRILALQIGVGGGVAGVVFGLLGLLLWRRGGQPLEALVRAAPESSHDVARVLSAIRHEVLKHNTTLLDEVAHALEHGDHHAVVFAAGRLFGAAGDPGGGVVRRFEAYIGALERMGRQHGVRLDLRRRDPVLAPMWDALRRLRGLERDLRRPGRARSAAADSLREISVALNETGYAALGRLVRRLGTLRITPARLAAVAERVAQEPGFAGKVLPELEVEGPEPGLPARVLSGDLEDVIANLVRNAWRAGATRTGVLLDEEEDVITGLEQVALRFRDDAPGELTDAMIHQRGIGRGLGLVVDLVTRHDGSICVEHDPGEQAAGWAKAVVVRFPRAETEEEP